jgi:hypothetical protein
LDKENIQEATDIKADKQVSFSVDSPSNVPEILDLEIFPLRNYVYFNNGSSEIPNRYVLLNKDQVKDFKEDQLSFCSKNLSDRSKKTNDCLL